MLYHKFNHKYLFVLSTALILAFAACNKDDNDNPGGENEEELITTVKLTFTNPQTNEVAIFEGKDIDGVGGNPPQIDDISLDAGVTYTFEVEFLDESNAQSVKNITEEVEKESDEHLVCFVSTGSINPVQTMDTDNNGAPLGLKASLSTGDAGNATLTIILKHEPDKSATDPCSTGETDVELMFSVGVF